MRVSSYSESIEHEVHFVLCELPFMLIDFQMMLEKNQWHTASTRNTSPLIYTQPRQRLKVCIMLHIEYHVILAKRGHFGWSWTKGCLVGIRGLAVIWLG